MMKSVRSFVSYRFFFTCKGEEDILIAGSCSDIVVGKDKTMELICLGDSLTYGYGVRSAQRWSTLVGQALQCEVTNLGICGDTTGGMLVRLNTEIMPKLRNRTLGQRPFVLLMGGVNDIFYSGTDTGARANMGAMLQELLTAAARCVLLSPLAVSFDTLTPEWREMIRPACEEQLAAYHSWQAAFCRTFHVPYIELYDLLRGPDGKPLPELYLDGLHPTAEGHRLMARRILALLLFGQKCVDNK